jgi:hypothetical protein
VLPWGVAAVAALVATIGSVEWDTYRGWCLRIGVPFGWAGMPMTAAPHYDALVHGIYYLALSALGGTAMLSVVAKACGAVTRARRLVLTWIGRRSPELGADDDTLINSIYLSLLIAGPIFWVASVPPLPDPPAGWVTMWLAAVVIGSAGAAPLVGILRWVWDIRTGRAAAGRRRLSLPRALAISCLPLLIVFFWGPAVLGLCEARVHQFPLVEVRYRAQASDHPGQPEPAETMEGYLLAETQDEWFLRPPSGGCCVLRKGAVDRIDTVPGKWATGDRLGPNFGLPPGGEASPGVALGAPGMVAARDFVLVDGSGRSRAELGMREGRTALVIFDAAGKPRAAVGIDPTGSPGVQVVGPEGQLRAELAMPDGKPEVIVSDTAGKTRAFLGLVGGEAPLLGLADSAGRTRAFVGLDASGVAGLGLADAAGTTRAGLSLQGKGPELDMRDSAGMARASLGVGANDRPGLVFNDAGGEARAIFGLEAGGDPALGMNDAAGKQRMTLAIKPDGSPDMRLRGAGGKAVWRAP